MNLNHLLEQTAADYSAAPALIHPGGSVSYAMLFEAVKRLARGFRKLGVNRGDRIAIMLPNLPQYIVAFYAALRLGAVVVPINTLFKGRETASLLEDSEARLFVVWEGLWQDLSRYALGIRTLKHVVILGESAPAGTLDLTRLIARSQPLADVAGLDEDDPAVVQYTSGFSASPKGAELSHRNILSNVLACREILKVTHDDSLLAALPLFHPLGQTLLMHLAIGCGASLTLMPKFEPSEVVKALRSGKYSIFVGVPSMFNLLLENSDERESKIENPVRLCVCGVGSIAEEVLKEFESRFGTYILECYTTSETSPVVSFNQWRTGRRVGSLGHPLPGVEMRVVNDKDEEVSIGEVGEIVVKGSSVFRRYINRTHTTEEVLKNGWFHTGDLGRMDINGFFYLVERLHDRILKGGFSVYPREVEHVLYGHPDVAEAAVVGIPDDIMGEEVKACVVLKPGAKVTTEQLAEYCAERSAVYKVPTTIRYYESLPQLPDGQIDKRGLKG